MTEKKIYFQWQNEELRKTIYPLRTMNLRNTLEYFMEIDLWKQYKDKQVEDMPEVVERYHEKKAAIVRQANEDYETRRDYFCKTQISDEEATSLEENMLRKIKSLHEAFHTYYDEKLEKDSFRKSYFMTQRLETLDKDRKELDKRIFSQTRYVENLKAMNQTLLRIQSETETLEKLQRLQPVFEERRKQLVAMISATGKLEQRKKDLIKQKESALREQKKIDVELGPVQAKIALHGKKLKEAQDEVRRARQRLEPEPVLLENYFQVPDSLTEMAHRFPQAAPEFCRQVDAIREEIASIDPALKKARLKEHIFNLELSRARFEKRTDLTSKEITLKAFDEVLDQMKNYWSFLEDESTAPDPLKKLIQDKEQELNKLQELIKELTEKTTAWVKRLDELKESILEVTDDSYVSTYRRVPPTIRDIVRLLVDEYRETCLFDGEQEKDQYQLLEMLIDRFQKEPERFPRWLQYMIVHLSGMRYSSAHGSWASPKDLYLNLFISLPMKAINDNLNTLDDFTIAELRQRKLAEYDGKVVSGLDHELPKFATTKDADSREKIGDHLALLKDDDVSSWRKGLLNLLLDEECYEMTDQQALEALEDLRERREIPDWMWKEITAVTELRLTEAKDQDWEKLTPAEQAQKNEAKWSKFREGMKKWKQDHLTGWREEHDRSNELIVSRAVCNEVAEHILHLRGHRGPAGLASAADWFLNAAQKDKPLREKNGGESDVSYFVKPMKIEDYRPGAALLWLKYRNDPPPQWNIVKPFKTGDGDRTLPDHYINGGRWSYKDKDGLVRSRTIENEKGIPIRRTEYLFWVHIATVADVAETAEGKLILTYETSLPYEDRRRSCVGVFKRVEHNLLFDGGEDAYNGSFVGYVPENPPGIPNDDLDEMLNWDHVLLRPETKTKKTRKKQKTAKVRENSK